MNTNTPLEQLLELKDTVKPTDRDAIRTLLCMNDLRYPTHLNRITQFLNILLASRGRTIGDIEINNTEGSLIEVIVNLEKPSQP